MSFLCCLYTIEQTIRDFEEEVEAVLAHNDRSPVIRYNWWKMNLLTCHVREGHDVFCANQGWIECESDAFSNFTSILNTHKTHWDLHRAHNDHFPFILLSLLGCVDPKYLISPPEIPAKCTQRWGPVRSALTWADIFRLHVIGITSSDVHRLLWTHSGDSYTYNK